MQKKLVSIISLTAILLLYIMIFRFSAQDGAASGSLSFHVAHSTVSAVNQIRHMNWSTLEVIRKALSIENFVRKLAHFSEYGALGFFICLFLKNNLEKGKKRRVLFWLWLILSACADETHQLFVPDRVGSVIDVCIDTAGGSFGAGLCMLFYQIAAWVSALLHKRKEGRPISGGGK